MVSTKIRLPGHCYIGFIVFFGFGLTHQGVDEHYLRLKADTDADPGRSVISPDLFTRWAPTMYRVIAPINGLKYMRLFLGVISPVTKIGVEFPPRLTGF